MKKSVILAVLLILPAVHLWAGKPDDAMTLFQQLNSGRRIFPAQQEQTARCFRMESVFTSNSLDSDKRESTRLWLYLEYIPVSKSGTGGTYVCRKFEIQAPGLQPETIPALEDWRYTFRLTESGADSRGNVLGIDRAKFTDLTTAPGRKLSPAETYLVYNTFIDFHSFCNVLGQPTVSGRGIQDLTTMGQTIVHAASDQTVPISLDKSTLPGSEFKNGTVTLSLNGIGLVDGTPCAIVGFDSGDCSFRMLMEPAPQVKVETDGHSNYRGDLYIDPRTGWVNRVRMTELVLSGTKVPGSPAPILDITSRHSMIDRLSRPAFTAAVEQK